LSAPRLALIAAVARNGVIGAGDALPWRLSSDLKRFKALTMGKPLIVGRKTFQAIGRTLPGRDIVVVTRDGAYAPEGVEIARDIDAALRVAEAKAAAAGVDEIFVGGGGEIYAQTIARAGWLYITEVDLAPAGDARFPHIDPALWREVRREPGARGPRDEADFAFVEYRRVP
jgi:dihydrofolate reductase